MELNGACPDAFPDPQANWMQVRRVQIVVVCIGQPRFAYVLWAHGDFDLMNFPRRGRGRARRRSRWKGLVAHWRSSCCHSFLKSPRCPKSTLSKVQCPRGPKGQSPTTLSEVQALQSRRFQKSDGVKNKIKGKIWWESDSIGRASQRPRTRQDECPDPARSRPALDTFPDPSPESDSSRFACSLNIPIGIHTT